MDLLSQYKINKCFRAYVERKYIGFISAALKTIKPAPQKKQSSANNSYRIKPVSKRNPSCSDMLKVTI